MYKIPIPQDSLIQACDNNNNNNNNNNQEPITDPVMIHCLLGTNSHMAKYDQMHLTFKANLPVYKM